MELDNRKKLILATIVDEYINSGEPVGSKAVVKEIDNAFSSATIRNEMAALTKMGLLEQPHTSAGRIPSYQGYQYYVKYLMQEQEVPEEKRKEIHHFFENLAVEDLDSFVETASEALTYFTNYTSISVTPQSMQKVFGQVEILPTKGRMVILLLATTNGNIEHQLVRLSSDSYNEEYAALAAKINKRLERIHLDLVTASLFEDLGEQYTRIYQAVEQMARESMGGTVIISGENRLFAFKEFAEEPQEMMQVLRGEYLRTLLDVAGIYHPAQVLQNVRSEDQVAEPVGLVAAKYHAGNHLLGTIGIVGPARMNYSEMVPYVYCFAREMGEVIHNNLWSENDAARLDDGSHMV